MSNTSTSEAGKLEALFDGYSKAHGKYEVKRVNDKGKNEGRAVTVREPVTEALWQAHIDGTGAGLGIIPLRDDFTAVWGVIDIDEYSGLKHAELEKQCKAKSLPLVVCRSKSGGAHLFLFLVDPLPAADVINTLSSWAAALGHVGAEIFPKQASRADEDKDVGNWLNMPYFNAERTSRYCVHDGNELDLPAFLEFADSMRQTRGQLDEIEKSALPDIGAPDDLFYEAPPCLQHLHANGGFPHGTRNEGMYNVAVYLNRRHDGDWTSDDLQKYNVAMCDPQMSIEDINTETKSVQKKKDRYFFKCGKAPINAHCNRNLCIQRKFGVGGNIPRLALTKVVGDQIEWLLDIRGKRVRLANKQLFNQRLFQETVGEVINDYLRTIPQPEFERLIGEAMQRAAEQIVPEEYTGKGMLKGTILKLLDGQAKSINAEQFYASDAHPWKQQNGEVWFKIHRLMIQLKTQQVEATIKSLPDVLREMGCQEQNKSLIPGKKKCRFWSLNIEAAPVEPDPAFGTTDF
ncbi:MAG: hypothetical protein JNK47_03940 [Mesorhizobium sp.]|nr:hypothetical protein [Mesorhizobium sp.]MBL8576353.1 hypothetical protein [Mesorhizobium sp.]